jgi:hypothetical protein
VRQLLEQIERAHGHQPVFVCGETGEFLDPAAVAAHARERQM